MKIKRLILLEKIDVVKKKKIDLQINIKGKLKHDYTLQ